MKPKLLALLITGLMVALTGCISFPRQPFNRAEHPSIKKIAVVPAPDPEEVGVIRAGFGTAYGFGLIGAAVEAGIAEERAKEFTQKMAEQKLLAGQYLTAAIEAELKSQGYDVYELNDRPIPVQDSDSKLDYDYSGIKTSADAILHAWPVSVRYAGLDLSGYVPQTFVCARLVSATDKRQLYVQVFKVGAGPALENVESLPARERYRYPDYETLLAKSGDAAEGIKDGLAAISGLLGTQLGGKPSLYTQQIAAKERQRVADEQRRAEEAKRNLSDEQRRAEEAAEATAKARAERWKAWNTAHPDDPCAPALAELKGASECAGAACSAPLDLAEGYWKNCYPEPETRVLVHRLRGRWEKETAGGTSSK